MSSEQEQRRTRMVGDLHDLAYYLEENPDVPAPFGGAVLRCHVSPEEFIVAARVLDGDVARIGKYVVCDRAFGVMALGVQTYAYELLNEQPEAEVAERVRALIDGAVAA